MNPSAAPSVDPLGGEKEEAATGAQDKPLPQLVLPAVWKLPYHLSLQKDDQFTAKSAILKQNNLVILTSIVAQAIRHANQQVLLTSSRSLSD